MTTIVNTHVGISRGKKRIWVEGSKLQREGFDPGMRFNIRVIDNKLCLRITEDGKYKVSRRKHKNGELPIIDISASAISELFDENDSVRLFIKKGGIVVSAHHLDVNTTRREERLLNKLESKEDLSICSLFHGGGVLDSALHDGFAYNKIHSSISIAVEIESKYLESSLRNNQRLWNNNSILMESPIQAVNFIANGGGKEVDLLIAGIPCTGASKSGRSKNKIIFAEDHSEAGSMFFYTLQSICSLNPAVVILENVPEYQSTASMSVIRSVLDSLGYIVQERVLNSVDFGCIEQRKRLVVVAMSKGIDTFNMESVITDNLSNPVKNLSQILDTVMYCSNRWKKFDYLAKKEVSDIAAGKGFRRQLLTGNETRIGVISKGYAKCRSTEPFIKHPNIPNLSRLLTVNEHAKAKGIPTGIVAGLADTVAHEILGQSVAYPVFVELGKSLTSSLHLWKENNQIPLIA